MRANLAIAILALTFCAALAARAEDPLLAFMKRVDAHAKADMAEFHRTVSGQFGVPEAQVQVVLGKVHDPADAFMIFQIGEMSHQPVDRVLPVYESHKGKGWGAMAKELGIKPGSAEFHALKSGDLYYGAERGAEKAHGKSKGNGKGKGKAK